MYFKIFFHQVLLNHLNVLTINIQKNLKLILN